MIRRNAGLWPECAPTQGPVAARSLSALFDDEVSGPSRIEATKQIEEAEKKRAELLKSMEQGDAELRQLRKSHRDMA